MFCECVHVTLEEESVCVSHGALEEVCVCGVGALDEECVSCMCVYVRVSCYIGGRVCIR